MQALDIVQFHKASGAELILTTFEQSVYPFAYGVYVRSSYSPKGRGRISIPMDSRVQKRHALILPNRNTFTSLRENRFPLPPKRKTRAAQTTRNGVAQAS